jgi:hypothetical protein
VEAQPQNFGRVCRHPKTARPTPCRPPFWRRRWRCSHLRGLSVQNKAEIEPIQPCFAVFFSWEQAKPPFAAQERFLVLTPLRLPPPFPCSRHILPPDAVVYKSPDPDLSPSTFILLDTHTDARMSEVLRNLIFRWFLLLLISYCRSSPHLFFLCSC